MRFFRFLISGWFLSLIGVLILAALIWFVGPLIAIAEFRPLDSDIARMATILVIVVLWGLINIFIVMRSRRNDEKLVDEIVETGAEDDDDPSSEASEQEVALLKERLQEAMALLKKSKLGGKGGRQYLYQLPWYVIIGPPGAGKTTALVNSGLKFPLADKFGKDAITGIGGTRNCDWWFTNEAVLIDTAGRYTTQDSDEAVDSASWKGFLGLLKKYRRRQPINGAMIAISLADLSTQSESDRIASARAIRRRIRELHEELGVRFPIYVLFTKTDLVAGFVEFFDDLGREDRNQVWGFTLPLDKGRGRGKSKGDNEEGPMALFDAEFNLLVERLNERLLQRLHQEPDMQRRSLIYGFPQQIDSLKQTAHDFLSEVFQPSRYEKRPLLRGVYFTSGTQLGAPIDRLMGAMARTFGIGRQAISAASTSGRSYFISKLLREVMFEESGIVGLDRRLERRRAWMRRGGFAVCGLAFSVMVGLWVWSFVGNTGLIGDTRANVDSYKEQIANLNLQSVEDTDFIAIVRPLNILRDLPGGYAAADEDVPLGMTFGLYQGEKLGSQSTQSYRRALNGLLLPRILLFLEQQMQSNFNRSEVLYELLKVYLMLGQQGPLDKDLTQGLMTVIWNLSLPGQGYAPLRADLDIHLVAMLNRPMATIQLDGRLIDQVRGILTEFPLAERTYRAIKQGKEARELPVWRLSEQAGPASARVLVRPSGAPLTDGIEGFYTHNGFHTVFLPAVTDVAEEAARDSWVLGPRAEVNLDEAQVNRLIRDVMGLYLDDYATLWDQLLADTAIVRFQSLTHSVEILNTISGPNSPVRNLLVSVTKETKLTELPVGLNLGNAEEAAEGVLDVALTELRSRITSRMERLGEILSSTVNVGAGGGEAVKPGKFVEDRFAQLHAFVGDPSNPATSEMENMLSVMTDLYRELNRVATTGNANAAALSVAVEGGGNASKRLIDAAKRMPQPMQGWSVQLSQASSNITVGGAREQLNSDWQSNVAPLCKKALDNRYPIVKGGAADVTLEDFSRLFKPGGMIDSFFNTNLRSLVDTSSKPWRWQRVDNVSLGIPRSALVEFERAAEIRDSLFAGGGAMPGVRFELVPVELDANSTQVILEINGQTISYNHGPPRPQSMVWPGDGPQQVRVAFSPPSATSPTSITRDGPWAWFRLLDEAQVSGTSLSDRFSVTFAVGDRQVTFELRANSVINPFTLKSLSEFKCPGSL